MKHELLNNGKPFELNVTVEDLVAVEDAEAVVKRGSDAVVCHLTFIKKVLGRSLNGSAPTNLELTVPQIQRLFREMYQEALEAPERPLE